MSVPAIIVIAGPTGAGKSALAFEVAKSLGAELINADSVSVYREFDIGSAKPTLEEQGQVPHHLLSIVDPNESFSAGLFAEAAGRAISEITGRGRKVIVVGGTGLYLRALLNGLRSFGPGDPGALVKVQEFESQYCADDLPQALYHWLAELDPASAAAIHPTHVSRIRRAILVRLSTGKSFIGATETEQPPLSLVSRVFWLNSPREMLYHAIESRTAQMIEAGLLDEVTGLLAKWGDDLPPLRSIGYAEAVAVVRGELESTSLLAQIAQATRRFAKRQLTWWRNEPRKLGWQVLDAIPVSRANLVDKVVQESQVFWSSKALDPGTVLCSELQILG